MTTTRVNCFLRLAVAFAFSAGLAATAAASTATESANRPELGPGMKCKMVNGGLVYNIYVVNMDLTPVPSPMVAEGTGRLIVDVPGPFPTNTWIDDNNAAVTMGPAGLTAASKASAFNLVSYPNGMAYASYHTAILNGACMYQENVIREVEQN